MGPSLLISAPAGAVVTALERDTLMLVSDPVIPSVVSLLLGRRPQGSWSEDARATALRGWLAELGAHPDLAVIKLLSGRDTWIHRAAWPHLLAVGRSREPWQLAGLAEAELDALHALDQAPLAELHPGAEVSAGSIRRLEKRLLGWGREVEDSAGRPLRSLVTWERFASEKGFAGALPAPAAGRTELQRVLGRLNRRWRSRLRLPWPTGPGSRV